MKKKHLLILLFFTFLSTITIIFTNKVDAGDSWFHIANIKDLAFISKTRSYYGYGVGIFYPPLAHFLGSIIYFILKPLGAVWAYKIEEILILFLSGLSMYYVLDKTNKKIKLTGSILYITMPYHLNTIIVRGALAEQLTFIFVPIILLSIYYLINKKYKLFFNHFIFGFTFMIYSHLVMSVYTAIFVLILLLVNFKKLTKESFKNLLLSSLFIVLFTLPFTLPLIDNLKEGIYVINTDGVMLKENIENYSLRLYDYFNYGIETQILYIDIIVLIFFIKSLKRKNKFYEMTLIFAILPFIMTLNIFPWEIMPNSLKMIQFPFRLLIFVNIPIIIGASLEMNKKWIYVIIFTTLLTLLNSDLTTYNFNKEDVLGWQKEYLPKNALNNFKPDTSEYLYYKGYTLYDENNNKVKYEMSDNGFIKPETKFTKIKYNGYNFTYIFMCFGIILLFFYNFFQKRLEKSYDI